MNKIKSPYSKAIRRAVFIIPEYLYKIREYLYEFDHLHALRISKHHIKAGLGISIFEYRYTEILKLFSVIF